MPKDDKPPDTMIMHPFHRELKVLNEKKLERKKYLTSHFAPELAEKTTKEIDVLEATLKGYESPGSKEELKIQLIAEEENLRLMERNAEQAWVDQLIQEKSAFLVGLERKIFEKS